MNTDYGISLGLDIPQLVCIEEHGAVANGVVCNKPNIFGKAQDNPADLVIANKLILLMINAFVDFFIQYYNMDETTNLQAILDLKKIIFSFTEPSTLAFDQTLLYKFRNVRGINIDIVNIRNEITIPARVGFDGVNHVIGHLHRKQKQMNLFLLGLSYKVLSMSGRLDISIDDMCNIIEKEKSIRNSFILQFLPVGNELPCFGKVELCLLQHGNSEIYRKIMALVIPGGGGSRNRNIRNNKNKNNKNKNNKNKNNKNKNSKHSTRRRRPRRRPYKIKTHKKTFS